MPAQEGADARRPAAHTAVVLLSESDLEKRQSGGGERLDVLVVGAGVIGLASGWRLAQRGLRTLVLEAGEPAQEATGVAAGMLAPVTEASFGEEALIELNLAAARSYAGFVAELEVGTGAATGYRATGTLTVALDRDQAEELRRLHEFQRSLGLAAQWLSGRRCRALEPGLSTSVVAGVLAPDDHQVSPRALAVALRSALEDAGGALRSNSAVESVLVEHDRVAGVLLESGERIDAAVVVVAAGARSSMIGGLPDEARVPVRPVKGQILRLLGEPRAPLAERVIRTAEVYAVPRADGRLIVGATVEERGFDRSVTAGGVLELLWRAYEALPGVTELELLAASAGFRPGTPDNLPIVGEGVLAGLVWATGHWRNGVLLAPVTADAVAELVVDGELPEAFHSLTPERFAGRALVLGGGAT
jgi:glycine oxidase